jgi:hypothetical protein
MACRSAPPPVWSGNTHDEAVVRALLIDQEVVRRIDAIDNGVG